MASRPRTARRRLAAPALGGLLALAAAADRLPGQAPSLTDWVVGKLESGIRVVAIGESHGLETQHAALRAMVRDPRFAEACDAVVVEFANSRHQELLDRYVEGEDVAEDQLVRVWRDTAVSPVQTWQGPMYRRFFATVREVNSELPAGSHLRVVAAGAPIDWARIRRAEDHYPFLARSEHYAAVVEREVLDRDLSCVLVAGSSHVKLRDPDPTPPANGADAGSLLREWLGDRYVCLMVHEDLGDRNERFEAELAELEVPCVVEMRSSPWEALDAASVFRDTLRMPPGGRSYNPYAGAQLGDLYDAVLYLGPVADYEYPPEDPITDPAELAELQRRADLFGFDLSRLRLERERTPAEQLAALSFLRGRWVAEDTFRGRPRTLEETWGEVLGNSLLCTTRWLDARGELVVVELITVTAERDGVFACVRQLRTPRLSVGRADSPIRLRLVELGEQSATFEQVPGQRPFVRTVRWWRDGELLRARIVRDPEDEPTDLEFAAR